MQIRADNLTAMSVQLKPMNSTNSLLLSSEEKRIQGERQKA